MIDEMDPRELRVLVCEVEDILSSIVQFYDKVISDHILEDIQNYLTKIAPIVWGESDTGWLE